MLTPVSKNTASRHMTRTYDAALFPDNCERKFGPVICTFIFNYISSSQSAINELELLDILSCNNEFFLEYFPHDLPKHLRFPPALWIAIKHVLGRERAPNGSLSSNVSTVLLFVLDVGPLLSERYFDLKVALCWSHSFIRRHMKQKYLKKVEDIRVAHRDIANYFLEAFIQSKPLVEMNRNLQIRYLLLIHKHVYPRMVRHVDLSIVRFLCREDGGRRFILQQPLLYSETIYNHRRLSELWYQLMHSGASGKKSIEHRRTRRRLYFQAISID
jgi:hypothetical protein